MKWVFIIGVSAICFGIIYYLNVSKKNRLMAEAKIIDRDLKFFKKEHIFETSVHELKDIGDAIDRGVLSSEGVSFEPNYGRGTTIFHRDVDCWALIRIFEKAMYHAEDEVEDAVRKKCREYKGK